MPSVSKEQKCECIFFSPTKHPERSLFRPINAGSFEEVVSFWPINVGSFEAVASFWPINVGSFEEVVSFWPINVGSFEEVVSFWPINAGSFGEVVSFWPINVGRFEEVVSFWPINADSFGEVVSFWPINVGSFEEVVRSTGREICDNRRTNRTDSFYKMITNTPVSCLSSRPIEWLKLNFESCATMHRARLFYISFRIYVVFVR